MLLNFLYCAALWLASPLVIYRAARYGRYRRGVRQKNQEIAKKTRNENTPKSHINKNQNIKKR